MIVSHSIKPFRRFGVVIKESVWIGDKPYFTARAIADWLELKDGHHSVDKIIRRNPFIKTFSKKIFVGIEEEIKKDRGANLTPQCPLVNPENPYIKEFLEIIGANLNATVCPKLKKSTSTSKRRRKIELTVFDPIGLQLIAMKARTKKAQEYQIKAAQVIWALYNGKLPELSEDQQIADRILAMAVPRGYGKSEAIIKAYMKKAGCTRSTAYRHLQRIKAGESPQDKKYRNAIKPIISGDLELEIRQLYYQNPDQDIKDIWKAVVKDGKPGYSSVKNFIRKVLEPERKGDEILNKE